MKHGYMDMTQKPNNSTMDLKWQRFEDSETKKKIKCGKLTRITLV